MPVMNEDKHEIMMKELKKRYDAFVSAVEPRALKSNPDIMSATRGSSIQIELAADDFKAIISQFRKLK